MRTPEYLPSAYDRVSTREELIELLELVGGFKEAQDAKLAETGDLPDCPEAEGAIFPAEILDGLTSEERLLMELEPFNSLLIRKDERIN